MKSFLFAVLGVAFAATANAESVNPLDAEHWKTRPLVIVVPSPEDPVLKALNDSLQSPENREAFIEREMVLYRVVDGRATRNDEPLTPEQADALLGALDAKAEGPATVFLVGKDGGVKVRQEGSLEPKEIFATIDQMPMRQ
ncbi:DUF4174 domain-containing protein [Pseudomonas matsuisoli]|uniref:DUF4174 domain-containing protein n=1 Tax=Pseudomonas matsuisoli TaxID=1515666 RepID=A0A917V1B8_9PSED|nr:DUF4174 domain-containing protein [Pseudomonas matsuisoli]GGK08201.1 hypothetical protein GCM10009304_37910 [Pseudomonas matsuisoli]